MRKSIDKKGLSVLALAAALLLQACSEGAQRGAGMGAAAGGAAGAVSGLLLHGDPIGGAALGMAQGAAGGAVAGSMSEQQSKSYIAEKQPAPATSGQESAAQRLRKLDEIYEQGLISDEEYATQRKEILATL